MKGKDHTGKEIECIGIVMFGVIFAIGLIKGYKLITHDEIILGVLTIVGGLIVGYLSSILLRGFGRLVDNSERSKELLDEIARRKDL